MDDRYDWELLPAYVRGMAIQGALTIPPELADAPLETLTDDDRERLFQLGRDAELPLYHLKRHEELPRVRQVMGFLRAVQPESLLDVGSGRGAFLFPFLRAFPWVPVTSLDLLPHRVAFLNALREGGLNRLTALRQDICDWDAPDRTFDVVTLLEVLEHIPDVEKAVRSAAQLARRYVVVSVPSRPDDNPEHIHLLTKDILTSLFAAAGCANLQFSGVNGHLILTARISDETGSDAHG